MSDIFTIEELARNHTYFTKPKRLQHAFFEYLKDEFQKNKTSKNKNNKERLKSSEKKILKELKNLKTTSSKKTLMIRQFNIALRKFSIRIGIRSSIELKHKLSRLRKILMRQKIRRLRRKKRLRALEEFEHMIEMHRLQLERDYDEFIKKLEEEKRKYIEHESEKRANEVANNLVDNITGSCEVLFELLEIDKKLLLPKLEEKRESLKNDFLYLELILKSEIEDSEEFNKKILDIVNILEDVYDIVKKEIADDIEKNQILDNWCNQTEITLSNWINNKPIEIFDQKNKEETIQHLTQNIHQKEPKKNEPPRLFTPLKTMQSPIPSLDLIPHKPPHRRHHLKPPPPTPSNL